MKSVSVKLVVLAENTAQGEGLLGEHGLSVWIETPEARVLFDTGQGLALPHNAAALGIDLSRADAIVLSHGHHDHTGGLPHVLRTACAARLFLHPSALASRFSRREGVSREIGMPLPSRQAVERCRTPVAWTTGPREVADGLFVTGPIPRRSGFEDVGGAFFLDAAWTVPDPIEDDQAMWLTTDSGTIVLFGCAHAGVINTLGFIREQTGGQPVRFVLGGMHLEAASDDRVSRTIEALNAAGVQAIWPCHCTGTAATGRFLSAFGHRCHPCAVGTVVSLGGIGVPGETSKLGPAGSSRAPAVQPSRPDAASGCLSAWDAERLGGGLSDPTPCRSSGSGPSPAPPSGRR